MRVCACVVACGHVTDGSAWEHSRSVLVAAVSPVADRSSDREAETELTSPSAHQAAREVCFDGEP